MGALDLTGSDDAGTYHSDGMPEMIQISLKSGWILSMWMS
jgi:hypothetical protein